MQTQLEVRAPVLKATIAWCMALLTDSMFFVWHTFSAVPWDKFAQFAAFIYSVCLIVEWIRKRKTTKGKENGSE